MKSGKQTLKYGRSVNLNSICTKFFCDQGSAPDLRWWSDALISTTLTNKSSHWPGVAANLSAISNHWGGFLSDSLYSSNRESKRMGRAYTSCKILTPSSCFSADTTPDLTLRLSKQCQWAWLNLRKICDWLNDSFRRPAKWPFFPGVAPHLYGLVIVLCTAVIVAGNAYRLRQ